MNDLLKTMNLPEIKSEHLPYAYGLIALGLLSVIKSPTKLVSIVGGVMLFKDLVKKGQEKINSQINP